jgi:hypothetical protein
MGFRSDEDARIHRIDALEGELDEKDAEIARLKAELEAEREADADLKELEALERASAAEQREQKATRARSPAKAKSSSDIWAFNTHMAHAWMIGIAWLAVVAGGAAYMHYERSMAWTELWPALPVFLMSLFFFHQHGLVLDKRAGTVTRKDRLLVFSWSRVRPYAGKAITIDRRYYSNKDGDSYWTGHVFLGDLKLFAKKEAEAERLAKQVAEFLGIACRPPSTKQMQRRAMLPLILTMVGVAIFLVVFFLREHLLG